MDLTGNAGFRQWILLAVAVTSFLVLVKASAAGASASGQQAAARFAANAECAKRTSEDADVCGIARDLTGGQRVSAGYIASVIAPMVLATGDPLGFDPNLSETGGQPPERVAMIRVPLYTNPGAIVPPVEDLDLRRVEMTIGNFLDSRNQED